MALPSLNLSGIAKSADMPESIALNSELIQLIKAGLFDKMVAAAQAPGAGSATGAATATLPALEHVAPGDLITATLINAIIDRLGGQTPGGGTLAGDVVGALAATVVQRLQGRPVDGSAPDEGQVLTFTTGAWRPRGVIGGGTASPTLSGDVTGAATQNLVQRLQGRPVDGTAPANGQVLAFSGGTWRPQTLASPDTGPRVVAAGQLAASGSDQLRVLESYSGNLRMAQDGQRILFDGFDVNDHVYFVQLTLVAGQFIVSGISPVLESVTAEGIRIGFYLDRTQQYGSLGPFVGVDVQITAHPRGGRFLNLAGGLPADDKRSERIGTPVAESAGRAMPAPADDGAAVKQQAKAASPRKKVATAPSKARKGAAKRAPSA